MAERSEAVEQPAVQDGSAAYSVEAEVTASKDLPPGYKRTEVGVIPEDWRIAPLLEQGKAFGGLNGKTGRDFGAGSARYVPFLGVMERHLLDEGCLEAVRVGPNEAQNPVRAGDVLLTGSSETPQEVAMSALVGFSLPDVYLNSFCFGFRLNERASFHAKFLVYLIRSDIGREVVAPLAQGSTRHNISKRALLRAPLPCPPMKEQRAIATALSDADALIESLDRLIAKKRAIKQAAMQQLLTGQTRLPGFNGEWETKQLGAIADIRSGGTPSTTMPAFWNGGIPWCTPTDITKLRGHKYLAETERTISSAGLQGSSAESIPSKSIIMTTRATIGECAINTVPMTTNQGFKNLIPSGADAEFIYYLMTTKKDQLIQLCAGSTFLEIGKKQLNAFELRLPQSRQEQQAIAAVLSDMDTEIEALEGRRDKARQIKQGMMQQLLTGRVRLVEAEKVCS